MCASPGPRGGRPPPDGGTKSPRSRGPTQSTPAPPATLQTHVRPNTTPAWSVPRPARNAPTATVLSAGTNGNTFSSAASTPISVYRRPGGRSWRNASRSVRQRSLREQRHRDHRDSLAPPDPTHALVGLGFDRDGREPRDQGGGEPLAHIVDIGGEAGRPPGGRGGQGGRAQAPLCHPARSALGEIRG